MFTPFGFIGMPGHLELLIIAAIILLLFGNRLPSVMRSMGRGIVEFKEGLRGVESDLSEAAGGGSEDKIPTGDVAKNVEEKP